MHHLLSKLHSLFTKPVNRIEAILITIILVPLLGVVAASAATTISTDITTGGVVTSTGAGNSSFLGSLGIGTTSPWALFSINPNGINGPAFAIGSSTATNFVVTNAGRVGIGTNAPATYPEPRIRTLN